MGLDSVELVLTLEESFGFSIPDGDAAELATVGKLYDYILTHRFQGKQEACLSSVTFYRIRRAMMSVLQISRKDLRLSSDLNILIPRRRRLTWRNLEQATALHFPDLVRPAWITLLASMITICLCLFVFFWFKPAMGGATNLSITALTFWCSAYVLYKLTVPLATKFKPRFATLGMLTKEVLARNYGRISDECGKMNATEIWDSLCSIISEQLGVARTKLTKETNFVRDLYVD